MAPAGVGHRVEAHIKHLQLCVMLQSIELGELTHDVVVQIKFAQTAQRCESCSVASPLRDRSSSTRIDTAAQSITECRELLPVSRERQCSCMRRRTTCERVLDEDGGIHGRTVSGIW